MGKTQTMIDRERREHDRALKRLGVPSVEVMTPEMEELAGLNVKYKMSFSSGTAGLIREKKK